MAQDDHLLTVKEVAARLRISPFTIRAWLRSGRLKGISLGSDHAGWRVAESDIQRIEREGMTRGS